VSNNTPYCVAGPEIPAAAAESAGARASASAAAASAAATARECAAEEAQRRTFTSTLDGLRKIARNEGPRTLWRGLSPTLVMAVPANVIYFAGYDWLRHSRASPFRSPWIREPYVPLVAGSTARVIAAVAVSPIEMFRTRMQAAGPSATRGADNFVETLQGLRDMVGAKGYRSLWTGLSLTLWRDVPFSAIYWWGYEAGRAGLRRMRQRHRDAEGGGGGSAVPAPRGESHTTTLVDSFAAGATSGAFAALVTTPFDVGKTRQQVVVYANGPASVAAAASRPEELSMPRFLWHIFKTQGAPGLFRGWTARCMKVAPACAIMISSYEIGKKISGGMNEKRG
jgi:solute carrier family 25 protein 39/40